MDGTSHDILAEDIARAYAGQELEPESCTGFDLAAREAELEGGPEYLQAKEFFAKLLDGRDGDCLPVRDEFGEKPEQGWLEHEFRLDELEFRKMCIRDSIDPGAGEAHAALDHGLLLRVPAVEAPPAACHGHIVVAVAAIVVDDGADLVFGIVHGQLRHTGFGQGHALRPGHELIAHAVDGGGELGDIYLQVMDEPAVNDGELDLVCLVALCGYLDLVAEMCIRDSAI